MVMKLEGQFLLRFFFIFNLVCSVFSAIVYSVLEIWCIGDYTSNKVSAKYSFFILIKMELQDLSYKEGGGFTFSQLKIGLPCTQGNLQLGAL